MGNVHSTEYSDRRLQRIAVPPPPFVPTAPRFPAAPPLPFAPSFQSALPGPATPRFQCALPVPAMPTFQSALPLPAAPPFQDALSAQSAQSLLVAEPIPAAAPASLGLPESQPPPAFPEDLSLSESLLDAQATREAGVGEAVMEEPVNGNLDPSQLESADAVPTDQPEDLKEPLAHLKIKMMSTAEQQLNWRVQRSVQQCIRQAAMLDVQRRMMGLERVSPAYRKWIHRQMRMQPQDLRQRERAVSEQDERPLRAAQRLRSASLAVACSSHHRPLPRPRPTRSQAVLNLDRHSVSNSDRSFPPVVHSDPSLPSIQSLRDTSSNHFTPIPNTLPPDSAHTTRLTHTSTSDDSAYKRSLPPAHTTNSALTTTFNLASTYPLTSRSGPASTSRSHASTSRCGLDCPTNTSDVPSALTSSPAPTLASHSSHAPTSSIASPRSSTLSSTSRATADRSRRARIRSPHRLTPHTSRRANNRSSSRASTSTSTSRSAAPRPSSRPLNLSYSHTFTRLISRASRIVYSATRIYRRATRLSRLAPTSSSPGRVPTRSPGRVPTRSPGRVPTRSPGRVPTRSPGRVPTRSPGRVPTRSSGPVSDVPDTSSGLVPDSSSDHVPDPTSHHVPDPTSHHVPDPTSHHVPGTSSDHVPGTSSDHVPGTSSDHVPGTSSDHVPDPSSDHVPDPSSDHVPDSSSSLVPDSSLGLDPASSTGIIADTSTASYPFSVPPTPPPFPEPSSPDGWSPTPLEKLLAAAKLGDLEQVKACLAAGVPIDSKDLQGNTALYYAAGNGSVELVTFLLSAGADPNAGGVHAPHLGYVHGYRVGPTHRCAYHDRNAH